MKTYLQGSPTVSGRFLPISARSPQKKCYINKSVNGTACTRGSPGQANPRGSAASPRLLELDACACYYAKSAHTRFVHSRGAFGLCLKSHLLDNSRDLWVLIQLG
jgi:hypothetical protein